MKFSIAFPLLLGMVLAGCSSSSKPSSPALDEARFPKFQKSQKFTPWIERKDRLLSPGNSIRIVSSADKTISGTHRISKKGVLSLPYKVRINAVGKSLPEVTREINAAYKVFLTKPDIKLEVLKDVVYVKVQGLVNEPGDYLVESNASFDELLAKAGGLTLGGERAPQAKYALISQAGITNLISLSQYFAGKRDTIPSWQGGEVVFLQANRNEDAASLADAEGFIKILGQVENPGEYPYLPQKDFFDYVIKAGGPTDRANVNAITLIRYVNGERVTNTFSMNETETVPPLQAGDALLFQAENPSSMEKESRIVGGFSGVISAIASALAIVFIGS